METNVKLLGWLYIVLGALGVLFALFLLVMLLGVGTFVGVAGDTPDAGVAAGIVSLVGLIVGGFILLISAPGILTGWGLLKFKSWARVVALVLAFFNLFNFPLGTALGVYALIVLLNDDTAALFE